MVKENLEQLGNAFNDEFDLWEKTEANKALEKVDSFLNSIAKYNILLFNTSSTIEDIKKVLVKDEDTQQAVLMFLLRVKYRFITYGGDWDNFISTLNDVSESINKDNTFSAKIEGFEQTASIDKTNMIQALLYYYILTPNLIISRSMSNVEKE